MSGAADGGEVGPLRPRAAALIEDAAAKGYPDAGRLWDMSLAEAALSLRSFAARREAEQARDERLAWMIGYYCAVAVHAPKRYPRRSGEAFRTAGEPMSDAQMQSALLAFAKKRGMNDDTGDPEN